jgi:hypothetical protein
MYGNGGLYGGIMSGWGTGVPGAVMGNAMPMFGQTGFNTGINSAAQSINGMPASAAPNTSGLGMNIGTAQLALSGLNSIGNLWAAFEAKKLAEKQFNFNKSVTNTNLANSIQSYNTALEDRARSRGFTEGQSQQQIDSYIAANQASRKG